MASDVIKVANGVIVEHWDTLQDEVTREESRSGLPMFGDRFPAAQPELTVERARTIVAPLYDALNQPHKKDVHALLAQACHADYKSYSTNDEWLSREALAEVFTRIGASVPDLAWSVKDIMCIGIRACNPMAMSCTKCRNSTEDTPETIDTLFHAMARLVATRGVR